MHDKAISIILNLLNDAFEHAKFPNSFYEVENVVSFEFVRVSFEFVWINFEILLAVRVL